MDNTNIGKYHIVSPFASFETFLFRQYEVHLLLSFGFCQLFTLVFLNNRISTGDYEHGTTTVETMIIKPQQTIMIIQPQLAAMIIQPQLKTMIIQPQLAAMIIQTQLENMHMEPHHDSKTLGEQWSHLILI